MGFLDWLTGKDMPARAYIPPLDRKAAPGVPTPIFLPHPVTLGTLVHGPGAAEVYRDAYAGGAYWNSIVYACITAICDGYAEVAPLLWQLGDDRKPQTYANAAFEELMAFPNPAMTRIEIDRHINYGKHLHGNAYLRKMRAGDGRAVEIWPLSPTACWPVRERGSRRFIDYYLYQWGSGESERERIPVEDIVHFRMGVDDRNHMIGAAPVRAVLREIMGDNNAAAFLDRMLRNNAVPGLVVTYPVEAGDPGEEAATRVKQRIDATFTGENQGSTAVVFGGPELEQFGFSPEQMDLRNVRMTPEERICAAFRVMPGYVGVGAGLERNTFSNSAEQRQQFSENTIIPLYRYDDAVWTTQLLPEFVRDRRVYVGHDIAQMRALQPDLDKEFARLTLAVGGPWLAPNEARGEVGYPDSPDEGMTEVGGSRQAAPATDGDDDGMMDEEDMPTPIRARRSVKAVNPREYEAVLRALHAGQEGPLVAALQTEFARLKRDVLRQVREGA
jgi:HK97 family phage portal protein